MASRRFLIAPFDEKATLQRDVKPWLTPDVAFPRLKNLYNFRNRIRKRFGLEHLDNDPLKSRLRHNLGTWSSSPQVFSLPNTALNNQLAVGQIFSIGNIELTITTVGSSEATLTTNSGVVTAVINSTATPNTITLTGSFTGEPLYWYPSLPVMGLATYEQASVNDEKIIAFDTKYSYQYVSGWERITNEATPGAAEWSGTNSQFFWTANFQGDTPDVRILFTTNYNENEANFMRFYDGTQWDNFRPILGGGQFLNSALILIPYRNRLLAMNTWEGAGSPGTQFVNRIRWSNTLSPFTAVSWDKSIPGNGSALDIPVNQAIITAAYSYDSLLIYCEDSTWELEFTNNNVKPFRIRQINSELGAESTFSAVNYQNNVIAVGNVGIHASNTSSVQRIDSKIPDEVFNIHNATDGPKRVYGIKDYYVEMVYWTFPNTQAQDTDPFPNRVLALNYRNGTWAIFDETITCFGFYQPKTDTVTWDSEIVTWDMDVPWSVYQSNFRQTIAGNQQGFTFICNPDKPQNDAVLQIANIATGSGTVTITSIDHNMYEGEFIYIQDISGGISTLNDKIFKIESRTSDTITIESNASGTYNGGGIMARVVRPELRTKEFNFFLAEGKLAYLNRIEFYVDSTAEGEIQVNYYINSSENPITESAIENDTFTGTAILDTFPYIIQGNITADKVPVEKLSEKNASRIWHPVYVQAEGEFVQLELTLNDEQMTKTGVRDAQIEIHAIAINATPTGDII